MEYLLLSDEIDVGMVFSASLAPVLDLEPQLVETLLLVVSARHALASGTSIGFGALSAESLVLLSAELATRDQIDQFCRQHGIRRAGLNSPHSCPQRLHSLVTI